jgi:hypothetical protein
MQETQKPKILIIDDNVEEHSSIKFQIELDKAAKVEILHPRDLEDEHIRDAQLVLVDYHLDDWDERDQVSEISLKPPDGLALSFLLRRRIHKGDFSPTAFALYTGKLDVLAAPLPPEYREHALASINNLEWVFQKARTDKKTDVANQIIELAQAVIALPSVWLSEEDDLQPMRQLSTLLGFEIEDPKNENILDDIEACLPPIHELSKWSHGLTVLRWLLHRILPFPCFLWDSHRLAARFRLNYREFSEALNSNEYLRTALADCEYKGVLANFLGPRWWRSHIESFLWKVTDGNSGNISVVQNAIRELAKTELPESSPSDYPVVCINTYYQPLDDFYSLKECVRIRPDDYPAYADQAWTTIELAKSDPKLRSIVIREDLELIA